MLQKLHRTWPAAGWGMALAVVLGGLLSGGVQAAAPVNDNFDQATAIVGLTNFYVSNVDATAEPGEYLHAGETPFATLWWQWTAPYTGTFRIVTSNSQVNAQAQLDTVVAVYTGDSPTNLMAIVSNDDTAYGDFGALWSRVVFRAYAGETFRLAAGSLGKVGTIRLEIAPGGPLMPPWQAADLQGQPYYSSNNAGQVVMIDFWETTCGACVEELPDLLRVQDLLRPRGFTFVGLSGDTKLQFVVDYLAAHPVNYPVAMSTPAIQVALNGTEVGYPTKILVDQDGRMVGTYQGGGTQKYYRSIIEPLLRTNSQAAQVRMRIAKVNASVRLFWPMEETGYVVQSAPLPTGPWLDVTEEKVAINTEWAVTFPGSGPRGFFRLIKR